MEPEGNNSRLAKIVESHPDKKEYLRNNKGNLNGFEFEDFDGKRYRVIDADEKERLDRLAFQEAMNNIDDLAKSLGYDLNTSIEHVSFYQKIKNYFSGWF